MTKPMSEMSVFATEFGSQDQYRGRVRCQECRGTGAEKPDCSLCRGVMFIHWRRAIQYGVRKADLEELEPDGFCRCPQCSAEYCGVCMGDGCVELREIAQEKDRVLVQGLTGEIPPLIEHRHWRGLLESHLNNDRYLSLEAAHQLRESGYLHIFRSIFGAEIHLTAKGEEAARVSVVRHQLRAGVIP